MPYVVGQQVEAEKTPYAWYRGTVEQIFGDSYTIRFSETGRGISEVQHVAAGKVRSVGAQLSTAPPTTAPPRLLSSASSVSASPRVETRNVDIQRRLDTLSEQLTREQTERRRLEERLLACEHLAGDASPRQQQRRDETVVRIERRLEVLERTTRADLEANQRRVTEALVDMKRFSISGISTTPYVAVGSSAHPPNIRRELEGRVRAPQHNNFVF